MNPTAPLLIDLAQLALELAGIIDPIGVSVVSSRAVSLARGSFSDAGISAASVVPSVGNAAGYGKIGRYLEGLRRACRLGLKDLQFGRILRKDLPKLQGMLRHLTAFPLPTTVRVRVFEMDTEISHPGPAPELLRQTQEFQRQLGRNAMAERNAPRTIDIDLLYFGDQVIVTDALELPHPRLTQRQFVLRPLADIRPDLILPGDDRTILAHLNALTADEPQLELIPAS